MNCATSTFLLAVWAILCFIVLALYIYFSFSYAHWKKKGIAFLKPTFPFGNIGNAMFQNKPGGILFREFYQKLAGNKVGGVYAINRPILLFRDPEIIKDVLVKNFSHFHDHGTYFDEETDPLMSNLFMLTGTRWKHQRTKLSPIFTSGKMKILFDIFIDSGKELGEQLKKCAAEKEIIEIKDILARYTTDVIASSAFGIQCNCLKNPDAEFRNWGRKIFQPTVKTGIRDILMFVSPTLSAILKIPFIPEEVTQYFRNMIYETVKYREENNIKRNDFMQLLIHLKNTGNPYFDNESRNETTEKANEDTGNTDTGFTIEDLASNALIFFVGGFETSSTLMSFCLYELALHPEIQELVQKEIDDVLAKHDEKITYEAVQEMTYMDKVVSESLRKYPPAPFLARMCTKDYTIPGTDIVIEKGTQAIIPTTGLHYDPNYYLNPEKFDPENFSDEVKNNRPNYTFLPFGEGPRICIGMRFGLLQTKVGLASVLSTSDVKVCERTPIPLKLDPKSFITAALGGMWLRIVKREK